MKDFQLIWKGKDRYLVAPPFLRAGVRHGFFPRPAGGSGGPAGDLSGPGGIPGEGRVLGCLDTLGLGGTPYTLEQVHGDRVLAVGGGIGGGDRGASLPPGDALVTSREGCTLGIYSADCPVIFLYDPVDRAVGLVHAGWRGTALGIGPGAVRAMESLYASSPSRLLAAISPAIGPCCYEVGEEVTASLSQAGAEAGAFYTKRPGNKWMLDLKGVNRHQLERAGIRAENIVVSSHCTCCDRGLFYSYRRDGNKAGRMLSLLSLVSPAGR